MFSLGIQDRFTIEKATLGDMETLFLYSKTELDHTAALQKHIARIQKTENIPAVIVLPSMSRYRRDAFVEARIPFVVPEKQLYLPFTGPYMRERLDSENAKPGKFHPAAQVLFFYYLYQGESDIYIQCRKGSGLFCNVYFQSRKAVGSDGVLY